MNDENKVKALLYPKNVVIIGASNRKNSWPERVWKNIVRFGFKGSIYIINPKYQELWGLTCYPSLAELPEKPDHIALFVPSEAVLEIIEEAAKFGARSATVYASGFGEDGSEEGHERGRRLNEIIKRTGMVISGPNCMGNVSAKAPLVTLTDQRLVSIEPGPVAVIGQSGGVVGSLNRTLIERGLNASYIISSGNEIGLKAADYIRFFVSDPDIKVVLAFIETVKDSKDFFSACKEARERGLLVVVIKIGGTEASRRATMSHTGKMAGSLDAFDAIAKDAGVIRVQNLDEMVEVAEYAAHITRLPKGPRAGFITFSGGLKELLLESADRNSVNLPELSPLTKETLKGILGIGTSVGNPLDSGYTGLFNQEAYFACIQAMLDDPQIDMLFLQEELMRNNGTPHKEITLKNINSLIEKGVNKPIAVYSMISHTLTDYSLNVRRQTPSLPYLQEVDKTMKVVRYVGEWAESSKVSENPALKDVNRGQQVCKILEAVEPNIQNVRAVDEVLSKSILNNYGVPLIPEQLVMSLEEAVSASGKIGFPVVLKIVSPDILHKTDAQAVILNLADASEVKNAYNRLMENVTQTHPEARVKGVLVAKQVKPGLELVMGINNDPEVGPVLMFGKGGIDLELYKDVVWCSPLITRNQAENLITKTKVGSLLSGYRSQTVYDFESVVNLFMAIAQLAVETEGKIESLDLNPVRVFPKGGGIAVLDALITLR